MVAIMNNDLQKAKDFFGGGDIANTLEFYDKALSSIDKSKKQAEYIQFLKKILNYCRENELLNEEALVLRSLGKTHSIFNQHFEALNYHRESLKIQRKLGNKFEVAEGLVFLAEDLEVSGNYDESKKMYMDAAEIFHDLGKLRLEKQTNKEISRIELFSKEMAEDEYIMQKFKVDKY